MTQKEKAQEIFNKFSLISPLFIEEKRNKSAKHQAIQSIELIIDELETVNKNILNVTYTTGLGPIERLLYYQGVKTELENL